jgi:hypothetical protein
VDAGCWKSERSCQPGQSGWRLSTDPNRHLAPDNDTTVHTGIVKRRPFGRGLTGRDGIGCPGGSCQRSEIRSRIEPTAFDHDLGEDQRYCDARE